MTIACRPSSRSTTGSCGRWSHQRSARPAMPGYSNMTRRPLRPAVGLIPIDLLGFDGYIVNLAGSCPNDGIYGGGGWQFAPRRTFP